MPELDEDLAGYGQPAPSQAVTATSPTPPLPPQFNTDISKGPTWEALPAPYQPPTQTGPWNSSAYISEAFKRLPPDTALKAMEAAIQLEGQLAYAADIKAGVPEMVALTRNAPKMYHRNPAVAARLAQPAFQPTTKEVGGQTLIQTSPNRFQIAPQAAQTGPIQAQEVMGPGGEALPGVTAIRGRGGSVHVMPERTSSPTQLGMLIKHQLDDIDKQLRDVGAEGGIQENSPEHKALLDKQKKYRVNLEQVTEEALNPKTRVPHPRPGQIVNGYRFKGGDPKKQSSWEKVS